MLPYFLDLGSRCLYLLASWKVCPINRLAVVFPGTTCLVSLIVWPRRILANGKLFVSLNVLYIPRYESKHLVSSALDASFRVKNEAKRDPISSSSKICIKSILCLVGLLIWKQIIIFLVSYFESHLERPISFDYLSFVI